MFREYQHRDIHNNKHAYTAGLHKYMCACEYRKAWFSSLPHLPIFKWRVTLNDNGWSTKEWFSIIKMSQNRKDEREKKRKENTKMHTYLHIWRWNAPLQSLSHFIIPKSLMYNPTVAPSHSWSIHRSSHTSHVWTEHEQCTLTSDALLHSFNKYGLGKWGGGMISTRSHGLRHISFWTVQRHIDNRPIKYAAIRCRSWWITLLENSRLPIFCSLLDKHTLWLCK